MKKILPIFLVWLVVVNVFALFSLNRFNLKADTAYQWIDPIKTAQVKNWDIVAIHAHWDSWWYYSIAEKGYVYEGPKTLSNVVFFPLYPLLMHVAGWIFFGNLVLAGWFVSVISLLFTLFYLYKLVKEFHPEIIPELPLVLLLIFPTAFFLNTVYAEALFLCLSVAAFYFARRKQFAIASVFGFFAALTRITGVLLFIPLLIEYFEGKTLKKNVAWLLLVPAGLASFFAFDWIRFGSPLLFLTIEKAWGRGFNVSFFRGWAYFRDVPPASVNMVLDIGFIIVAVWIAVYALLKVRASYGIYMLLTLAMALSSGSPQSIGRYCLVLFPIYIVGAKIKNDYVKYAWQLSSVLLFALYTILFVNNYWAG